MSDTKQDTLHVFYGRMPSFKHILKNGVEAIFQPDLLDPAISVFRTSSDKVAQELKDEIATGHQFIYQVEGKMKIAAEDINPYEQFKRKIIEDYEAERLAKSTDPSRDMGVTNPNAPLIPASSAQLAEVNGGQKIDATPALAGAAKQMLSMVKLQATPGKN